MPHPGNNSTRPGAPLAEEAILQTISGRYSYRSGVDPEGPGAARADAALIVTLRVDVDGEQALGCLSIEVVRRFPHARAHAVAALTADRASEEGDRTLEARISYVEGERNLLPGQQLIFEAIGLAGGEPAFVLTFSDRPGLGSYPLSFDSRAFDAVEFEVDRVENAGPVVTRYHTGAHPNRPADLREEELSLASVYRRVGFEVSMSDEVSTIPLADAGSDGAWSDEELHNAMVTYWSRFADRPQWAMWVLYANRHEMGESLGGVMFDDIGDHHRQGTAIFTRSFIQDAPPGDPAPEAWRDRMQFWTAIHEMGHAFNLAHSWQKDLSTPAGDPWVPLRNRPEARSFMNYPFNISGGEATFFADFHFRFTAEELLFMRHAPRHFVQMGHSGWFENHGVEAPEELGPGNGLHLHIRCNRKVNTFAFMEPVMLELKLVNRCGETVTIPANRLASGQGLSILIQREGRNASAWRPMITRFEQPRRVSLGPGESLYAAHNVSVSTDGWLIDEPGFYKVQAALEQQEGQVLVSNVLRLYVAPPAKAEENRLAPDYFTEEVARTLVFHGAPSLPGAMDVLETVASRCPRNPAALHAAVAVSAPDLRDYKLLDAQESGPGLRVRCRHARPQLSAPRHTAALMKAATRAADTFGHIAYFETLENLSDCLYREGDVQGARKVLRATLQIMKKRSVLESVITRAEKRLAGMG